MDQKRFIPFFAISMLIFFGWALLARKFFPPPEVPPEEVVEVDGDPVAGENPVAELKPKPEAAVDDPSTEPNPNEAPAAPTIKPQWFTLGSMKPGDPYQMAITLNNQGAAIENIELVTRDDKGGFRYRDLDDDSGYLGYLALSETAPATEAGNSGVTVQTVIPGSPAAQAGVQAGDRLLTVNEAPLPDAMTLRVWLKENSKPGDQVVLEVERAGKPVKLTATLSRRPLSVISPEFQLYPDGSVLEHQLSFLLSLERLGDSTPKRGQSEIGGMRSLRTTPWEGKPIEEGLAKGVEFTTTISTGGAEDSGAELEIVKRYWLRPKKDAVEGAAPTSATPGFEFTLEIEFHNKSEKATRLAYRLDGPTGLPKEGWWYANKIHPRHFMTPLGARDVIWSAPATGSLYVGTRAIVKEAEDDDSSGLETLFSPPTAQPFRYVGVDAQYFSCVLRPEEKLNEEGQPVEPILLRDAYAFPVTDLGLAPDDKGRFKNANVTYQLNSGLHELAAGESFTQRFEVFAGPKDPELLAQYGLADTISYGWFGIVSKPLLRLLHGLYWITGSFSYGIAIVLLTLIVRSCLMPLGLKAARSAKKMQELAPEIKKLKEKYPDNMEKQWAAQQELFKKHNASQFGGCLPMFLQLPIFLGLYRGLAIDIELRQAPLIPGMDWCTNLAGPDKLFFWQPYIWESLGSELGWLGPYFNLLPVITVILFYAHQKLFTPPATDDQQKQMQQVMSFMMIFFCVMFFKVPAGLCLYFITSSLWGLGERLFLKKDTAKIGADADRPIPAAAEAKAAKVREEQVERRKELARKQKKR